MPLREDYYPQSPAKISGNGLHEHPNAGYNIEPVHTSVHEDTEYLSGTELTKEAVSSMKKMLPKLKGLFFSLCMKDNNELIIYGRTAQPCYGELRKYYASHTDYTDPEPHDENRPADLYQPFPEGIPVGLIVKQKVDPQAEDILAFLYSPESPWRRGFVPGQVEFIRGKSGTVEAIGFYNLDVDPTVLVNLLNCQKSLLSIGYASIGHFISAGATMTEALGIYSQLNINSRGWNENLNNNDMMGYYWPVMLDYKRFASGDAHDLTGGTFRDRYDYNRVRLADIFLDQSFDTSGGFDSDDTNFVSALREGLGFTRMVDYRRPHRKVSHEEIIEFFRGYFNKTEDQEKMKELIGA